MALLKTSLLVALTAFFAQVHFTTGMPTTDLTTRQATCANLPGFSDNERRAVSFPLDARQTTTSYVTLGTLSIQDTPCFPPTVDVSPISTSTSKALSDGRAHAESLGHFLKDCWSDVVDVVKVVSDLDAVLEWGDVVDILKLAVDGYHLYTDLSKTIIDAESLDGSQTVSFHPIFPIRVRPDPPCGGRTGKMCP